MRKTDKTLLEQMQISDIEIANRMNLLPLSHKELQLLPKVRSIIEEKVDQIVTAYYESQLDIQEVALLIGDADTLSRLRLALRKYILDLFSGEYDSLYVNNRLRIGLVHKRIGVEPKLFLSAISTLKNLLNLTLTDSIEDSKELSDSLKTLDKLLYFDMTLVFDTYIDSLVGEIEAAKKRTELYAESLEEKVAERTKQLEEMARVDPLTSVFNQRVMYEMLRKELAVAQRRHTRLCLIYFDIDKFKEINDRMGHVKGDEVLKHIGSILQSSIRETDIACRYGGDEFCLILPECGIDDGKNICEKIITAFAARYPDFSLSMGIVETGPDEFINDEQLIKTADTKMYLAKKTAGSQIRA